jgi:hypothetical protein
MRWVSQELNPSYQLSLTPRRKQQYLRRVARRRDRVRLTLCGEPFRMFLDTSLVGSDGVVFYFLRTYQQQVNLLADFRGQPARVGEQIATFHIFDRVRMRLALHFAADRERLGGVFLPFSVFVDLSIIDWHGPRSH